MTSASVQKWRTFNCFSVRGTGGSPAGPDPENRVGDQDTGSPGRPVSSGLQVSGEPGHCRARIIVFCVVLFIVLCSRPYAVLLLLCCTVILLLCYYLCCPMY